MASRLLPLSARPLDVVVFGATGDTGSAACRLLYHHSSKVNVEKWAPAARDVSKLERSVLSPLMKAAGCGPRWTGAPLQADSNDLASLVAMCNQTRVVVACAGPYSKYGEKVIAACILSGCHYVDVTGEVDWVNAMQKRYNKAATQRGVSVVSFCGYDSVPMDLSAWLIADALSAGPKHDDDHATLVETFGMLGTAPPTRVKVAAGAMYNDLETGNNHQNDAILSKRVKGLVKRDLSFNSTKLYKSPLLEQQVWSSPHFMASINTPIVHSTAEHSGFPEFKYHERAMSGGRNAWKSAHGSITAYFSVLLNYAMMAAAAPFVMTPFFEDLVWWYVRRTNQKSGTSADKESVDDVVQEKHECGHNVVQQLMNHGKTTGYVSVLGYGESVTGKRATTSLETDYDAGIGFTMLSALSVAGELNRSKGEILIPNTNGFQTPVCAVGGHALKDALRQAGVRVAIQVDQASSISKL